MTPPVTHDAFLAIAPAKRHATRWQALLDDVEAAAAWQRGGLTCGMPELGGCPPSALAYLRRCAREGLGDG